MRVLFMVPTDEPAPALRMYAGDADFFGIVEAREVYLQQRDYEKTMNEISSIG